MSPADGPEHYDSLADVYDWLLSDDLRTPAGFAAAYADQTATLPPGARVLDCAAGTGLLAVGLAERGFAVTATDASPAMVERIRALAAEHAVELRTAVCAWADLAGSGLEPFDAIFCVGNSITHARGRAGRRAALAAMAALLRPGGLLLVTSRNWERLRERGSGLRVARTMVERHGRRGLVVYAYTIADRWRAKHTVDVAVAFPDSAGLGEVTSVGERLPFWPFRHTDLVGDLRRAGLTDVTDGYQVDADRYLVTARAPGRVPIREFEGNPGHGQTPGGYA